MPYLIEKALRSIRDSHLFIEADIGATVPLWTSGISADLNIFLDSGYKAAVM